MDDEFTTVNLGGNTFRFYGVTYTGANRLFVNSNGLITFGSGTSEYINTNLTGAPAQPAIAVYWDDLIKRGAEPMVLGRFEDLDDDGTMDRLIIEWYRVEPYPNSPRPITFQAHLYLNTGNDSVFTLNYFDLDSGDGSAFGAGATVGSKAAGNPGPNRLLVSFNATSIYHGSGRALVFFTAGAAPGDAPAPGGEGKAPFDVGLLEGVKPATPARGAQTLPEAKPREAGVVDSFTLTPRAVEQTFAAAVERGVRPARVADLGGESPDGWPDWTTEVL